MGNEKNFTLAGIEVRFDPRGEFDEVLALGGEIHGERMDEVAYWLGVGTDKGQDRVVVWLSADDDHVTADVSLDGEESSSVIPPEGEKNRYLGDMSFRFRKDGSLSAFSFARGPYLFWLKRDLKEGRGWFLWIGNEPENIGVAIRFWAEAGRLFAKCETGANETTLPPMKSGE